MMKVAMRKRNVLTTVMVTKNLESEALRGHNMDRELRDMGPSKVSRLLAAL